MSDSSAFGFGKFIPGFDFLQNLSKAGQSASAMPQFSHWIAPTLSVEEIDKRIEELKAVQFWLEQNNRALSASVQALQVQRMTLSTLQGMNVPLGDVAQAFPFAGTAPAGKTGSPLSDWPLHAGAKKNTTAPPPAAAASGGAGQSAAPRPEPQPDTATPDAAAPGAQMGAALQWWGALTQQFQQIAQQALQDPAQQQAMLQATQMTTELAKTAVQTASEMVRQAVAQGAQTAKPPAARKTSGRRAAKTAGAEAGTPAPSAAPAPQPRAPRSGAAPKAASTDKKRPRSTAIPKASPTKKKVTRKPAPR